MNILELIKSSPVRKCTPPESLFEAEDESGDKHLVCFASFLSEREMEQIIKQYPSFPTWTVTKEHFTQEEWAAWKAVNAE